MTNTLLVMKSISKRFPGVQALEKVDFEAKEGEVHALVGENGAGKSTLMKVLIGIYPPDEGKIFLNQKEVSISNPLEAEKLGISMIFQEFNLIPHLTVAENIFFSALPHNRLGKVNWKELWAKSEFILRELEIPIEPKALVKNLTVSEMQMVEIAKALSKNARILIMDEPTSALTRNEVEILFKQIRKLTSQGVAVIFIGHHLEEIKEIADRITVLRDGHKVATVNNADVSQADIAAMMVGRRIETMFPKTQNLSRKEVVLTVKGLTRKGIFENISFSLKKGEVLGIYGLVGSGRTQVARSIFGEDPIDEGEVLIENEPVVIKHPKDAVRIGIGLVPEDRSQHGLLLRMSVRENIALPNLEKVASRGWINSSKEREMAADQVNKLSIKTPSLEQKVLYLSGGNQQKVVVAKWLEKNPRVLILDEPTRGIDVGAKAEIYNLIDKLSQRGVGVIMISSELPEILGISDRILVMREGKIVAELTREEATPQKIIMAAAGGTKIDEEPQ
ncbi:MAG: ribose transport system ATP-binding protein [Candidatus Atribacteria bacterium]|uniref:sugar ABC transporter ATP-binding protein n=1 Tax=Atrimonas thermophila TaxID=3064161 RepID=UPI0024ABADD2|nr:ribose transport system ATP-binding protein [Candidatus Atribacteria bacterium]MDI3531453.1 ribose transport system ATP-binding protein [Candidatus Atribacteria bacterium]